MQEIQKTSQTNDEEKISNFLIIKNDNPLQIEQSRLKLILDGVYLARCDIELFTKFLDQFRIKVNTGKITQVPSSPGYKMPRAGSFNLFQSPVETTNETEKWESHIVLFLDTLYKLDQWVEEKNCEAFCFAIFTLAPLSCLLLFATLLTFELSLHFIFIVCAAYTLTFTLINYWIFSEERKNSPKMENLKDIIYLQLQSYFKEKSQLLFSVTPSSSPDKLNQFNNIGTPEGLINLIGKMTSPEDKLTENVELQRTISRELSGRTSPCRGTHKRKGDDNSSDGQQPRRQRKDSDILTKQPFPLEVPNPVVVTKA